MDAVFADDLSKMCDNYAEVFRSVQVHSSRIFSHFRYRVQNIQEPKYTVSQAALGTVGLSRRIDIKND